MPIRSDQLSNVCRILWDGLRDFTQFFVHMQGQFVTLLHRPIDALPHHWHLPCHQLSDVQRLLQITCELRHAAVRNLLLLCHRRLKRAIVVYWSIHTLPKLGDLPHHRLPLMQRLLPGWRRGLRHVSVRNMLLLYHRRCRHVLVVHWPIHTLLKLGDLCRNRLSLMYGLLQGWRC